MTSAGTQLLTCFSVEAEGKGNTKEHNKDYLKNRKLANVNAKQKVGTQTFIYIRTSHTYTRIHKIKGHSLVHFQLEILGVILWLWGQRLLTPGGREELLSSAPACRGGQVWLEMKSYRSCSEHCAKSCYWCCCLPYPIYSFGHYIELVFCQLF